MYNLKQKQTVPDRLFDATSEAGHPAEISIGHLVSTRRCSNGAGWDYIHRRDLTPPIAPETI